VSDKKPGKTACLETLTHMCDSVFTCRQYSISLGVSSDKGLPFTIPALLISMVTWPTFSITVVA